MECINLLMQADEVGPDLERINLLMPWP